jgi:GT2 family glycosyltransferase
MSGQTAEVGPESGGDTTAQDGPARMAALTRAVVVHYGDPELTNRAVSSLMAGSVAPGLIVVVDNSPTPFPDPPPGAVPLVVVRPGRNTGFAGGVTIGLEAAPRVTWDYAWMLNNDAVAATDALSELLAAMTRADGRALISSLIRDEATGDVWFEQTHFLPWRMESRGRRLASPLGADLTETRRPSWRSMPYISGCSLLVPSAALTAIGGFDRSFFMYSEDVDLSTRSLRAGFSLVVAPRSVVVHRTSSGTHFRHRERMVSETSFRLTAKHYPWLLPPGVVLAFATALKRSVMRRQAWWMTERFRGYRDALKSRPR